MSGFRRTIFLSTIYDDDGGVSARACLEDDFHHFRVQASVKDGFISFISSQAIRYPYITCPDAGVGLRDLLGKPAERLSAAVYRQADARLNCTHMLDLAGLAIANIVRGTRQRKYEIFVSDRHDGEITGDYTAKVMRDGEPLITWQASYETISYPKKFAGIHLRKGFAKWAMQNLPEDETEAALVLRRCAMISMGRTKNLESQRNAPDWGFCYSQQKERAPDALRVKGSIKDFSNQPHTLCESDISWVNFDPEPTTHKHEKAG